MELREFLYLDARLVDQFLAQVEGGIYDEEREKSLSGKDGGFSADVGGGIGPVTLRGSGRRGASSSDEIERIRKQTPESRYNRLHEFLESGQTLQAVDTQSHFGDLKVRGIVAVECYVDVPTINRAMRESDSLSSLGELISAFAPQQQDPQFAEALEGMKKLNALTGNSVVATGEIGEGQLKFAFKLNDAGLRVDLGDLEGDAVVVGKVEKTWTEGKTYPLLSLPGLNLMNREARRKMEKEVSAAPETAENSLEGPAATLSVIAIFR